MSFDYSGDPSTSPLDEVRFLLQDTDETKPLLQDEEINYAIARLGHTYGGDGLMAAAYCADVIAGKYAGEVSISADGVSVSAGEVQQKYQQLAISLRATYKNLAGTGGDVFAGGLRGQMAFGLGLHDNLRAGQQDYAPVEREFYPDNQDWLDPGNYQP